VNYLPRELELQKLLPTQDSLYGASPALELNSTTHLSLINENSEEKRELLEFTLSNSSWVDGKLEVEHFEGFDLMRSPAETAA
jgi:hypothetical protein